MLEIGRSGFLIMFQRNTQSKWYLFATKQLQDQVGHKPQSTFLLYNIETVTNCSYRFQQQIEMH